MTGVRQGDNVVALRPRAGSAAALRAEVAELRDALQSRIVIEQAKGAVSVRLDTTPEAAFEMMRGLARSQGRSIQEYAAAIIANGGRLDC